MSTDIWSIIYGYSYLCKRNIWQLNTAWNLLYLKKGVIYLYIFFYWKLLNFELNIYKQDQFI